MDKIPLEIRKVLILNNLLAFIQFQLVPHNYPALIYINY
jgi:hypothetical protein